MDQQTGDIRDYRDLVVWQEATGLAELVYSLTCAFPREEAFGLTSQVRRAAVSIPSNVAEGFGRAPQKTFIQFLSVAQGSLKSSRPKHSWHSAPAFCRRRTCRNCLPGAKGSVSGLSSS